MKKFMVLSLLVTNVSCGGSDEKTENDKGVIQCSNGVELNLGLVGTWEAELQRNGGDGLTGVIISDNCTYQHYETGNHLIMDEWHGSASFENNIEYYFSVNPAQEISIATDNELYIVGDAGDAVILNNTTKEEIVSWQISSVGGYLSYELISSDTLISSAGDFSITLTKKK
jgi:hypothetical protein